MLTVSTLGTFHMMWNGITLKEKDIDDKDEIRLLLFLILYRKKPLMEVQLSIALWDHEAFSSERTIEEIFNSLQNKIQSKFGDVLFVIREDNTYRWNEEIKVNFDGEQFAMLVTQALSECDLKSNIEIYERALTFYKGDFMSEYIDTSWISTRNTYYHNLFVYAVRGLAELYCMTEQYEEIEELCHGALLIENSDDLLYGYLIKAYVRKGSISLAMECYEQAKIVMEQKMKIKTSGILDKVYKEFIITNKDEASEEITMEYIEALENQDTGVFECSYPIFREMYKIEVTESIRYKRESQILLIKVDDFDENSYPSALSDIQQAIRESLREGDVVSTYKKNQYIILLSRCNYEQSMLVANRILSRLYDEDLWYSEDVIKISVVSQSVSDTNLLD
ncbi:BTAD domain-containing putative transcriptional regulator [Lachnobacterium bovis]|uniref:DNA-binding transcriptional activator of the SARP family n=1 Tax=Lachnobacterium bovis TaxID=140626 RepID=A0A1H9R479_9FIRM|nr:BTAD domain-containing putative transcriptional regulator [Lachnobacterium bovis]SER67518.1 DNA-binding transcriptional activator of the SARP family [Lachnobacterium bovis]